jgi:hypothetical protein
MKSKQPTTSIAQAARPIIITTLATRNYLPRAQWCVNYLNKHADPGTAWLGAVGCDPCQDVELGHVGCYLIPSGMLDRSLGNPGNGCIQHGNWLPYLGSLVPDDAVIICIDGDVKMQRPFSAEERAWLAAWPAGAVGIGPNEPKEGGDSMGNELCRIKPILSDTWTTLAHFGVQHADPIGNAGCVVATKQTWIRLWMAYLRTWMETAPLFEHIAVQQWTLNLCINRHFDRVVLPQAFHTHGHWGDPGPPYAGWGEDGVATVDGEVILFAHKTW